jgi:hypothetical protein
VHQVCRSCWDQAALGRGNPAGRMVAGSMLIRRAGSMLIRGSCSREDMESLTDIGMPVVDNMLEAGSNREADNNREAAHNTVEQ